MKNKDDISSKKYRYNKISYLLLGFNDGISTLSQLAINYFFKDTLKVSPSTLTQILTIISLPWMTKPLFGLLSDILPICGYRRKIYIIICALLNCLSWIIMAYYVNSIFQSVVFLLLVNISISFSSVLGQAIVVELSKNESEDNKNKDTNDLVSWYFLCKYIGVFVASFLKGYLIEKFSIQMVFIVSAGLPIITLLSGIILVEEKVNEKSSRYVSVKDESHIDVEEQVEKDNKGGLVLLKSFCSFFFAKKVLIPTCYIIFLLSIPNYKDTLWFYCNDELNFTPNQFGIIAIFNTAATLLGIFLFKMFLSKTKFRKVVIILHIITVIAGFLTNLLVERFNLKLYINDFYFVIIQTSLFLSSNDVTTMPMLTLACNLCPKNLEGSVYAMFMSALNLGELLSGFFGSMITNFLSIKTESYGNFGILVYICNIMEIVPIFILMCIPEKYFPLQQEENKQIKVKEVTIEMSQNNKQAALEGNNANELEKINQKN